MTWNKKIILILAMILSVGAAATFLTGCGCEEHSEVQKIEVEE